MLHLWMFVLACGSPGGVGPGEPPSAALSAPEIAPPVPNGSSSRLAPVLSASLEDLPPPVGEERRVVRVAPSVTVGGVRQDLTFTRLLVAGEGDPHPFGSLLNARGEPIRGEDGAPRRCQAADYNALLPGPDGLTLITHLECRPAVLQVTRLSSPTGPVVWSRPADLAEIGGASNLCAGDLTPWGAVLSGEEYDPDARRVGPDGKIPGDKFAWHRQGDWTGDAATLDPYAYGWVVASRLDGEDLAAQRHYAMGRFSHELAIVLPDQKTALLSDDGTDGALFLFVADQPGDLSAGALYAARFAMTGPGFTVSWVPLGRASDAEIAAAVGAKQTAFADLFEVADPVDGRCPEGLTRVVTMTGEECLRAKPGKEVLISRLESRRAAALAGATTELRKAEGLAYDSRNGTAFLALSELNAGMLGEAGRPRDDLAVARNDCGGILALTMPGRVKDTTGAEIPSDLVPQGAVMMLTGRPEGEGCAPDGIANPDNLTWIPGYDWLLIDEDSPRHDNNVLWAWHPASGRLQRLLTAPAGGEISGTSWYVDPTGAGYIPVSVQRPFGRAVPGITATDAEKNTFVGMLGPFPTR